MDNELMESLKKIAIKKSTPFCYSCYKLAPTGRCEVCGSDDLMKITKNNGPEFGIDWIIKDLIETELTPVDTEEAFEEYIEACYPEHVQVAWLSYDVGTILKKLDLVTWELAKNEFIEIEASEVHYITFDNGSSYYLVSDVERLIDDEGED